MSFHDGIHTQTTTTNFNFRRLECQYKWSTLVRSGRTVMICISLSLKIGFPLIWEFLYCSHIRTEHVLEIRLCRSVYFFQKPSSVFKLDFGFQQNCNACWKDLASTKASRIQWSQSLHGDWFNSVSRFRDWSRKQKIGHRRQIHSFSYFGRKCQWQLMLISALVHAAKVMWLFPGLGFIRTTI